MNLQTRRKHPKSLLILAASLCCLLIAMFQTSEIRESNSTQLQSKSQINAVGLKKQLIVLRNSPTFGFRNLLAGGTFLNFLQYFSDTLTHPDDSESLSPDFFDTILTFEPFYTSYYLFLSTSTTFHAAQPEKTVELMKRGLEQIEPTTVSDSFYIWRYKGIDELLFLGDGEAAQHSFETAADWAAQSDYADSDIIEKASRQTAEFLAQNPESEAAQMQAWGSVLASALSQTTRQQAIDQIEKLGGKVTISENGQFKVEFPSKESR